MQANRSHGTMERVGIPRQEGLATSFKAIASSWLQHHGRGGHECSQASSVVPVCLAGSRQCGRITSEPSRNLSTAQSLWPLAFRCCQIGQEAARVRNSRRLTDQSCAEFNAQAPCRDETEGRGPCAARNCLADWHALHILLPYLERASQKARTIYCSIKESNFSNKKSHVMTRTSDALPDSHRESAATQIPYPHLPAPTRVTPPMAVAAPAMPPRRVHQHVDGDRLKRSSLTQSMALAFRFWCG